MVYTYQSTVAGSTRYCSRNKDAYGCATYPRAYAVDHQERPQQEMNTEPDITPDKRTDPTDNLLSIREVAERCQCSETKVRQWIAAGRIAYVTLGDGKKLLSMIRVRESALARFWRENEREAI